MEAKWWALAWDWNSGLVLGFDILWDAKSICLFLGIVTVIFIWDTRGYVEAAKSSIRSIEDATAEADEN